MRYENARGATDCDHDFTDVINRDFNTESYDYHVQCRKCHKVNRYHGSMTEPTGNIYRGAPRPRTRGVPVATRGAVTSGSQIGRRF